MDWADVVSERAFDVTLPANRKVLLSSCSVTKKLGKITIPASSELIFADEAIDISVTGIVVFGKLRAGSETCRLQSYSSITLRGSRPNSVASADVKGIHVDGGVLEIHAAEYYHTWSRLAVTAQVGDDYVLLQDAVNWDVGASVLVTTTQVKDARDWHQNEVLCVKEVRDASYLGPGITAVYFDDVLRFGHYGGKEYQAEVGLLTRRFVIQGDAADSEPRDQSPLACGNGEIGSYPCGDSFLTGYGGHVMIEGTAAEGRVSGVEFYRMGQTNFMGRYPLHFHQVKDNGAFLVS